MTLDRRVSIAPMLDWTDRHCRFFLRLIAPDVLLYTEMVTTGAILFGDKPRHLDFDPAEHPVALQLGGSEPIALATCAKIAADWLYDEINLNCGCPSDRVQAGSFGACLMKDIPLVADCIRAMKDAVPGMPVTVKARIGVDEHDSDDFLHGFVETVANAGCDTFILHARKAWLKGLSPKENREVPPLDYDRVVAIKRAFPHLCIVLNGGIKTVEDIHCAMASGLDGVMIGREGYENPWSLHEIETEIFGRADLADRLTVLEKYAAYMEAQMQNGVPLHAMTRHITGLFNGLPGARGWRRMLSGIPQMENPDPKMLLEKLRAQGTKGL